MRVKHRIAAVGATVALSSALALGVTGTASASTATAAPAVQTPATQTTAVQLAAVRTPVEPAACRRVWRPGAWYWFDRGSWDRFHRWQHHREHRQYPGRWGCG